MADVDKIIKAVDGAGKAVKKIVIVGAPLLSAIKVVAPIANKTGHIINEMAEKNKNLVAIPRLYTKNVRLLAEQAKKILEERELKPQLFPVEKDIKYKDCFEFEVVESDPKEKQKIERGSFINVYYVTANVIEESKAMFIESERQKAEEQADALRKKAEEQADNDRKKAEKADEYLIKIKKLAEDAENRATQARQKAIISSDEAKKARLKVDEIRMAKPKSN